MALIDLFQQPGLGGMITAPKSGSVDQSPITAPHIIDEQTNVSGIIEVWTYLNIIKNLYASSLYKASDPCFGGVFHALV